jgi:excisionase family DNA binding protein
MFLRAMTDESDDLSPTNATRESRPPMTAQQAAAYLGVTIRFVRRLIAERRIDFYKEGRLVRISPDVLDGYLDSCRVPAVRPATGTKSSSTTRG